jgi:hypothetical protein
MQQTSNYLTIGTPDSNGFEALSTGFVRLKAIADNPGTTGDESDVLIAATITDVMDVSHNWDDYVGELKVSVGLRLTDRYNGTQLSDPATVSDTPFETRILCAPNTVAGGSTCSGTTTADALMPGLVAAGRRAIWQLNQVRVYDGGADGLVSTNDGNGLFAVQGVFVP